MIVCNANLINFYQIIIKLVLLIAQIANVYFTFFSIFFFIDFTLKYFNWIYNFTDGWLSVDNYDNGNFCELSGCPSNKGLLLTI